jgi:hypothetical protein
MSKSLRNLAIIAFALVTLAVIPSAKADPTDNLNMTFESGATFSGVVTFAPDYSYVEEVSGTLNGYQYGTYGYTGSGSDSISWLWYGGDNYATASGDIYGTFLMDGPPDDYTSGDDGYYNYIDFTYDYTNAPTLVFDNNPDDLYYGEYDPNGVNGYYSDELDDPMISGSFTPIPEPSSLWLLGSGVVGLAGMVRRKIGQRV